MIFKGIYNVVIRRNKQRESLQAKEGYGRYMLMLCWITRIMLFESYLRNDHSSTLPIQNNSYYYPAVTGSFVFSDALNSIPIS